MIAEPLTIVAAASRIRQGTLTPSELLEHCLACIDQWEPLVNAWVLIDRDAARAAAEALTAEARQGQLRGPLHGIPIGVKDIFDVAGWPTRAGAALWGDRPPASEDAAAVAALRAAGAVMIGKTVTTEFAGFDPPCTRNPWNLQCTPGGSSSGSAAAVATGMCLAALGSQTGGSITRPTSFCGTAGWKPTHGWLSVAGVMPQAASLDTAGIISASARDLLLLAPTLAMASSQPADVALMGTMTTEVLNSGMQMAPPRIAWFHDGLFAQASPDVQVATQRAVEMLRGRGAVVDQVPLPASFETVIRWHRQVNAAEAAFEHRHWYPQQRAEYGPMIARLIQEGTEISALDYQQARWGQARLRADAVGCLDGYDAILTAATVTTAPGTDTTGDSKFNAPWSYTGLPTVSVPCGLAADGLPAAIQLVGNHHHDAPLLRLAAWCEEALGFQQRPTLPTDA